MLHSIKLRSVWNIAKGEYIKWVTNPRIVTVGILLVFIHSFAVQPMLQHVEKYGEPLNVFEPFLAVCNSGMMVLFIPVVFILLMSDFPVMGSNTLLTVQRAGKLNWFWGQMLFVIMCIVSFITAVFSCCMLMSKGIFQNNWSNTIALYNSRFPEEAHSFVSKLLPPNLYNQMSLTDALFYTIILLSLYLLMIALILCLMKMLYLRTMGIFSVIAICAIGTAICALQIPAQWLFPTSNTLIWLHYQELLREPVIPISTSLLYFIIGDILLLIADLLVVHRLQFRNIEQEGD